MTLHSRISAWIKLPWLPDALSGAGIFVFLLQLVYYANTQLSRLDEGLYQVKGYYFAIGKYLPFEPYGPLTNHMPLSFIIPGYVQAWFGPGIRTGRYFAVVLAIGISVVLWLTARRLGGTWWGAAAVWMLTLNVANARVFSLGISQVLVAFFLGWAMYFGLGQERKRWQLILSAIFAALTLMTRINLAPVLPLLMLYFWWQHGFKEAFLAGLAAFMVIVGVHALYWPGILKMWAYWIPEGTFAFLDGYYAPWQKTFHRNPIPLSEWIWDLESDYWNPMISFWHGVRYNFLAFMGFAATLLLWPSPKQWRSSGRMKQAVFLTVSYLALLVMHMWAALGGNSCHVFCFSGYLFFFNLIGLILIVLAAREWLQALPLWRQVLIAVIVLLIATGVGFGAFSEIGKAIADLRISSFQGYSFPLSAPFQNKYGLSLSVVRQIVSALAGLIIGVLILVLAFFASRWMKKQTEQMYAPAMLALVFVMGIGMLFSSTPVFGAGETSHICGSQVLDSYEQVGEKLAANLEPGAQIYWRGGQSILPLLYLPDIEIYPPQMNDVFTYAAWGGPYDADELYSFSLWNEELKETWIAEADAVLVEGRRYKKEWQPLVEAGEFEILITTAPTEDCRGDDSRIIVLLPIKK